MQLPDNFSAFSFQLANSHLFQQDNAWQDNGVTVMQF